MQRKRPLIILVHRRPQVQPCLRDVREDGIYTPARRFDHLLGCVDGPNHHAFVGGFAFLQEARAFGCAEGRPGHAKALNVVEEILASNVRRQPDMRAEGVGKVLARRTNESGVPQPYNTGEAAAAKRQRGQTHPE